MAYTYLVAYDLRNANKDYTRLFDELKQPSLWWHYLDSTWIIRTEESIKDVYTKLSIHIDDTDHILIIEVKKNWWGWLPTKGHDWIRENV